MNIAEKEARETEFKMGSDKQSTIERLELEVQETKEELRQSRVTIGTLKEQHVKNHNKYVEKVRTLTQQFRDKEAEVARADTQAQMAFREIEEIGYELKQTKAQSQRIETLEEQNRQILEQLERTNHNINWLVDRALGKHSLKQEQKQEGGSR